MHVVTFHPLQSNMQDEVNTNCMSAVFPRDKNWKANLLDSNNLTSWQNMEVLQLLEELKDDTLSHNLLLITVEQH